MTTTPLCRSADQIAARLREVLQRNNEAFVAVEASRLLDALPYEVAREWLNTSETAESWEAGANRLRSMDAVKAAAREYLQFAWMKANDSRGNSALRSLAHFRGLVWLCDYDKLSEVLGDLKFASYYGKPALRAVSEWLGEDWRKWDNNEWRRVEGGDAVSADAAWAMVTA